MKQQSQTIFLSETVSCKVNRRKQSRHIRLTVQSGGQVMLSLPQRVSLVQAKAFLAEKKEWILEAYHRALNQSPRLLSQGGAEEYRVYKEQTRRMLIERVGKFCLFYGVSYRGLSVRNQHTRFGSCSASGHLSFNYRLIFLPESLLDYVVAHEVCHLLELNHSQKFWALVARTIPDYQERKRQLQAFSRTSLS